MFLRCGECSSKYSLWGQAPKPPFPFIIIVEESTATNILAIGADL